MDAKDQKSTEEANREATEKMERNDEQQNRIIQQKQNELTKTTDPEADDASLLHTEDTRDSVSTEEQNNRRLEEGQDEDFGNEQIK